MSSSDLIQEDTFDEAGTVLYKLAFTTGNTPLKLRLLDICGDFHKSEFSNTHLRSRWICSMRMFVLDWDRQVRARAFRLLRLALTHETEKLLHRFSIHKLMIIRLESSKSPHERVSVLRLISHWLTITRNSELTRFFIRSLSGVVIAHSVPLVDRATDFYSTALLMVLAASIRFPDVTLEFLVPILNSLSTRLNATVVGLLLDNICDACASTNSCVQLANEVISSTVLSRLSNSITGISILHHSLTSGKVIELSETILELTSHSSETTALFTAMLRQVPDIGPALIHASSKSSAASPSITPASLKLLTIICPPNTIDYMQRVSWRFPNWFCERVIDQVHEEVGSAPNWLPLSRFDSPELPNRSFQLSPDHTKIVCDIMELISSVQYKSRSGALTIKRQQNPKLFQSPALWVAVYDMVLIGSFNLHARRIIHGLFVHAICSSADLDLVDSLSSS